jgi:hypothetical protein
MKKKRTAVADTTGAGEVSEAKSKEVLVGASSPRSRKTRCRVLSDWMR